MTTRQEDEEAMAERMSNPYGEAGFGVGEVLGRGAAKRQQEILTGAEYSANQAPPGYRPGFDPEYLYFGDPRYSDYAALLPGVYGQPPVAGTPPVAAPPVAGMPDIGGLPRGSLENLTQANVEDAMKLIAGGQYDIYSLADELELDRGTAMTAYDKYLRDTFGMGTFNPNVDELSEDDIQKYFGIANQQGYNPEQLSRIFGIPLDQSRSSLAAQYFKDIPVDEDYSDNEAQQVYDLYRSGRMGVTGISNYFGIPSADVQRILGDIEGAGGIVANIPGADTTTADTTTATTNTANTTTANTATANTATANTATVASPLAGIEVDGDYSSTEADQVYDMYVAGQVTPLQISQYFDIPLGEINTALSDIGESRRQLYGDEPDPGVQVARSTPKKERDPDSMTLEDNEGEGFTPLDFAFDLYQSGTAIPQDQIRDALVYAQANGISFSELDRMFDAPDGSAQDAAAALGLAASSGGIVGMAEGREVGAYDESYSYPYGVDAGMQESLEIVDKITDLENSMSIEKDSDKRRRLEMELDSLKKFGGAVNGISKRDFTNFVEVQKLKNKNQSQTESTGMAEGGGFPDLSGDGEITQEDILMGRGVINKAEGGYIGRDQLDGLIKMTRDAILGDAENADQVIQEFISVFGNEAFQQLREQVLQTQVPDAQTEGMIEGQGGGMDDEIMGMIGNQQPVAVSPGEYIVPADVVASLGDGSSDAGSSKLDTMLDDVRMAKTGRTIQPGKINDRVIPA
jgi:hypothetical protein|tara:strand:+ start:3098 stop:5332 length:2235 start_codon:yes stop_codon:yes gene_type:complete